MKTKNFYSVSYYLVYKLTFSRFFLVYQLFWYTYINENPCNKVNITVKILKDSNDNWFTLSNHSFNTFNFKESLLYFQNIISNNYEEDFFSEILFEFDFDYNYNNLNLIKSQKFFSLKYVLSIIFIYTIFILSIIIIILHFNVFNTDIFFNTDLFLNIDLIDSVEVERFKEKPITNRNCHYFDNLKHNIERESFLSISNKYKLNSHTSIDNIPISKTVRLLNDYYNSKLYRDNQNLLSEIDKLIDEINRYKYELSGWKSIKDTIINEKPY